VTGVPRLQLFTDPSCILRRLLRETFANALGTSVASHRSLATSQNSGSMIFRVPATRARTGHWPRRTYTVWHTNAPTPLATILPLGYGMRAEAGVPSPYSSTPESGCGASNLVDRNVIVRLGEYCLRRCRLHSGNPDAISANCQGDIEPAHLFFKVPCMVLVFYYVFYQRFCHHMAHAGLSSIPESCTQDRPFTASFIIPHEVVAGRPQSSRMRLHGVIDVLGPKKFTWN
jgi:hypothetical protein